MGDEAPFPFKGSIVKNNARLGCGPVHASRRSRGISWVYPARRLVPGYSTRTSTRRLLQVQVLVRVRIHVLQQQGPSSSQLLFCSLINTVHSTRTRRESLGLRG